MLPVASLRLRLRLSLRLHLRQDVTCLKVHEHRPRDHLHHTLTKMSLKVPKASGPDLFKPGYKVRGIHLTHPPEPQTPPRSELQGSVNRPAWKVMAAMCGYHLERPLSRQTHALWALATTQTQTAAFAIVQADVQHLSGLEESVLRNIQAAGELSEIVRTSFGPNGA